MYEFDIPLVAEGLTAYAIERKNGFERRQVEGAPPWSEQRRLWTDAILQGMARLSGHEPNPQLMDQYDQRLAEAQGSLTVETAPLQLQRKTIRTIRRFVKALEKTGDDRRRQVDVVYELLNDLYGHLPWLRENNKLVPACDEAESALLRMTAMMPIRFTRILLGGDASHHWVCGFVSGSVTDVEAIKQSAIYAEALQKHPEVTDWPALCTVYLGRNLTCSLETVDACEFDLKVMNRVGDRFLDEWGIRCVAWSQHKILS